MGMGSFADKSEKQQHYSPLSWLTQAISQQRLPDPPLQPYDQQLLLPFMSPFMEICLLETFHLCVG